MSEQQEPVETGDTIDPELVTEQSLAHPAVPTTINQLAASDKGVAIIEQRIQIFNTLRVASIQLTFPNDWTLFKAPDGRVSGFLGDQGCDRIKKLWGVQVNSLGKMELVTDPDKPGEFAYRITGDGTCGLTGEAVFDMEGVRYSTERYATEKPEGLQRHVAVQKAARANLDGSIVRELTGLKSVPSEELNNAWKAAGTPWKTTDKCNLGRGFGSGNERAGAASATSAHGIDPQDIPNCGVCQIPLVFRAGAAGKDGFFGCRNWEQHRDIKVTVSLADARKNSAKKQAERDAQKSEAREPGAEG